MKALKIIGIVMLVALIGFGGLVFYGLQNLDRLVELAVEKIGTDVVGTNVELGQADIGVREGRGELSNLTIANPDGYNTDYAFSLGTIALDLDPASVTRDVVVIEEVLVDEAVINAEAKAGLRQINLNELAQHVARSRAATESGPPAEEAGDPGVPNFRVEKFTFGSSQIYLTSPDFGDRTIALPAITANDLGGEKGLPPQALAAELVSVVLNRAKAAVADELEDRAKSRIREEAKEKLDENLSDENKQKLDELKSILNR